MASRKRARPPSPPATQLSRRSPGDGQTTMRDRNMSTEEAIRWRYHNFPSYRDCLLMGVRVAAEIKSLREERARLQHAADILKVSLWPIDQTIPDDPSVADPVAEYINALPNSEQKRAYRRAVLDVTLVDKRIARGLLEKRRVEMECHRLRDEPGAAPPRMPQI